MVESQLHYEMTHPFPPRKIRAKKTETKAQILAVLLISGGAVIENGVVVEVSERNRVQHG